MRFLLSKFLQSLIKVIIGMNNGGGVNRHSLAHLSVQDFKRQVCFVCAIKNHQVANIMAQTCARIVVNVSFRLLR
jgi:hypothetical protein